MGLPQLSHPTFSLILPSTKQEVRFRPFVVREEKILLIAQSSGDPTDVVKAIKQVVSNCIIDRNVDVENFTTFDLEYFFIKLRAKSVNSIVKLSYKDAEDGNIYDVEVDLDGIEVTGDVETEKNVSTGTDSGIVLRYPKLSIMRDVEGITDPVEFAFAVVASCIDKIYVGDEVHKVSDYSTAEVQEFLDSLDVATYEQIQRFVDQMPKLHYIVSYTNSNGKKVDITLSTLTDFFTLG